MTQAVQFLSHDLPTRVRDFRISDAQQGYADSIARAMRHGRGQLHCIEGDTGIGKTLGYLLPAVEWLASGGHRQRKRRVVIATHSRTLQRQIVGEMNRHYLNLFTDTYGLPRVSVAIRMGRQNYVSIERLSLALGTLSLGDFAEDTRQPPKERALAHWAITSDGCLANLDDEDLPEGISRTDISLTWHDPLPDELSAEFERARQADIIVGNHALLVSDLMSDGGLLGSSSTAETEVCLIVDEGEHFAPTAESCMATGLSYASLSRLAQELGFHRNADRWSAMVEKYRSPADAGDAKPLDESHVQDLRDAIRAIRSTRKVDPNTSQAHAAWAQMVQTLPEIERGLMPGHTEAALSFSPVRGLPSLIIARPSAGAIIHRGLEDRITIFTSATLSDMQGEERKPKYRFLFSQIAMSAHDERIGLCERHEARNFGRMTFRLALANRNPLDENSEGRSLSADYASHAAREILNCRSGRTLVLCASYRDVDVLDRYWPDRERPRITTHGPGVDLNAMAESMPANGVLVTPAGWEGLSPTRAGESFWKHIAILRVPNTPVNQHDLLVLTQKLAKRYQVSDEEALRRARIMLFAQSQTEGLHKLRQGLGRGLRHPDDEVEIVILDPRFVPGSSSRHSDLSGPARAIPARFQSQFRKALDPESNTNKRLVL